MERRILVAEDSPTQAGQLSALLQEAGYMVAVSGNGSEALAAARAMKPAIIVSDIVMAQMDGYALCRAIKSDERLKDIPVILVTVLSSPPDVLRALECGADVLIRKPYDEEDLLSRLRYIEANAPLRKGDKAQIGVEIEVAGRRHFVTAAPRQILDLLVSTYDQAVHMNEKLAAREREVERAYRSLNALYGMADGLNRGGSEREVLETALEWALELPGVGAGWVCLREGEAGFRLAAARNLPPALEAPGALEGECACRRKLLAGDFDLAVNILECDRLRDARGDTRGLRCHAGVPLWIGDRTLGVMNLVGPAPGVFRDEDLKVLYAVGHQLAVSLERARLVERLEAEVEARTAALTAEVAQRRRAEGALRSAEAQFRGLVEQSLVGIYTIQDGRFLYANPRLAEIFGYTQEEIVSSRSVSDLVAEQDRARVSRSLRKRLEGQMPSAHYTFRGRRKDGTLIDVEVHGLRTEVDGRPAVTGALLDVTERRRAENARARLTAIVETTPDVVGIADAEGRVLYLNRAGRQLLGIPADGDVAPLTIAQTHPDWARAAVMEQGLPTAVREGVWSGETAFKAHDGREVPMWQVIIAHRGADGGVEFLSTVARDLTERKRAEEGLRQTEKLAVMGELLAGVAHEMNNPLSIVMGQTALLRQAVEDEPAAERAEKIAQAAERCARIVRNFLALARQRPVERQRTALDRIVREAVELLAYQLRVDSVKTELDLGQDVPILWADPHQLHQVLVNLIANAHHAMRETPPPRRLTFTSRFDAARNCVVLAVADTGPGIPPEIQARIFEPFFTTKAPGEGTGLGLSLCRGVIQEHGGSIQVESQPGRGTVFRVTLPVTTPPATVPETPAAAPGPSLRGKTILVVDDDALVAELLADLLAIDGHQVDTAPNGVVALTKLRERTYDLIVSDVKMPELDGPGLYGEVERRHPGLRRRFVFITGDLLSRETKEFLEQTGAPHFSKPVALEDVRRAVQRALRAPGSSPPGPGTG
jgi:PAS domain S-box-containing protein